MLRVRLAAGNRAMAAARISGSPDYLPMMADCERGLGRPERALALATSAESGRLDREGKVELLIVAAGARRDLGQADAGDFNAKLRHCRCRGSERRGSQPLAPGRRDLGRGVKNHHK